MKLLNIKKILYKIKKKIGSIRYRIDYKNIQIYSLDKFIIFLRFFKFILYYFSNRLIDYRLYRYCIDYRYIDYI